MAIDLQDNMIRVYNYEQCPCGFKSKKNPFGNHFRAREEDEEFVVERVPWEDIEAENNNSKSDLFRVGRLRFHPDEEDEVYKKLNIKDRENIMTDKELVKVLHNDSMENIRWISNLKSTTLLLRMKKMMFKMERASDIPPHNIIAVVSERNNELKNGTKRAEKSVINEILRRDQEAKEDSKMKETIDELRNQIKELSKPKEDDGKLDEIMAMMKALKEENENLRAKVKEEPAEEVAEEKSKPRARRKPAAKKEDE